MIRMSIDDVCIEYIAFMLAMVPAHLDLMRPFHGLPFFFLFGHPNSIKLLASQPFASSHSSSQVPTQI